MFSWTLPLLQSEEESQLRSSAEGELGELRRRLAAELEEERGGARAAHEKELGALQQQLREEHQQVCLFARSDASPTLTAPVAISPGLTGAALRH